MLSSDDSQAFQFISFSSEFRGSGKVWCLPKEPTSKFISGLNPESGKLANKLVNKIDLLGRGSDGATSRREGFGGNCDAGISSRGY